MTAMTDQDFIAHLYDLRDALLNIKRLAEKSGDHETDPFALLELIAEYASIALQSII